jgi:hypothetical protein
MATLLLDPDIRDWVVLPLFVIMIAAGLLRHYVGTLLQGDKTAAAVIPQRAQNFMRQTTKIRSGAAHYMPTWKWYVRKQHYAEQLRQQAAWCQCEQAAAADAAAADSDPMSAMMNNPLGMMKGNMAFMVQNMVMMQGIQHFFSGFILLKVPFPLTVGFKQMFQRGLVELPDLESSYVSSVSWYFLVMYGLRSFFKLAIGDPPLELREQDMLLASMGFRNAPNPGQPDPDGEAMAKQLLQEAENLELFMQAHKSEMDGVEKRLLGKKRYPKKKMASSNEADFLLGGSSRPKSKKKQ